MERNKRHVLIVDDSKTGQHMIKSILEKEGFKVKIASTVSEALMNIGSQDIGTVLVDFYLAGYNNGIALVKKIRKYNVDVSIYAISSSADTNDELYKAGCNGIISKNIKEIRTFLKNYPQPG